MVVGIATPEGHEIGQRVRQLEAERPAVELLQTRAISRVQNHVIEGRWLHISGSRRVANLVDAGHELDDVALGILEADRVLDPWLQICVGGPTTSTPWAARMSAAR